MNFNNEYIVKHSFPIEGRGLVLVSDPEIEGSTFHAGDQLSIARVDGSAADVKVISVEILSTRTESTWVVVIPEKSDVPIGSKFSLGDAGDCKYDGMTVNERLFAAGLLNDFDSAARSRDRPAMVEILSRVSMTPEQCDQTTDAILSAPETYGY